MATFTIGNFNGLTFADFGLVTQSLQAYGMSGTVTNVGVSFGGLQHTFSDDLDMVLSSSPDQNGSTDNYLFWSDVGEDGDLNGSGLTIAGDGSSALPDSDVPFGGTFRPADYENTETAAEFGIGGAYGFYRPPPTGVSNNTFAFAFGGNQPNGAWTLRVRDDTFNDTGGLDFWSLEIETNGSVAIAGTAGADTIRVNLTGLGAGTYQMNGLPVVGFRASPRSLLTCRAGAAPTSSSPPPRASPSPAAPPSTRSGPAAASTSSASRRARTWRARPTTAAPAATGCFLPGPGAGR